MVVCWLQEINQERYHKLIPLILNDDLFGQLHTTIVFSKTYLRFTYY